MGDQQTDESIPGQRGSDDGLSFRAGKGLLHHSDGGGQDAGHESQGLLKQSGMTWSMSRKGDSWHNSVVESSFHLLKAGCTHERRYLTGEEAPADVID